MYELLEPLGGQAFRLGKLELGLAHIDYTRESPVTLSAGTLLEWML